MGLVDSTCNLINREHEVHGIHWFWYHQIGKNEIKMSIFDCIFSKSTYLIEILYTVLIQNIFTCWGYIIESLMLNPKLSGFFQSYLNPLW